MKTKNRYVALLRAVNVGGTSIIKMEDLRKLFESLGFDDVVTYIQSGNVIFGSPETNTAKLARLIEGKLKVRMGHPVTVFVLAPAQLKKAASANPFDPERHEKEQYCQIVFLSQEPSAANTKALMALQGKEYRFSVLGTVLYMAYDKKYAGPKRRTVNFEKVLGAAGTARTWKVVDKLIELSQPPE